MQCLVTKLKAVVDNDNLEFFNAIKFTRTSMPTGSQETKFRGGKVIKTNIPELQAYVGTSEIFGNIDYSGTEGYIVISKDGLYHVNAEAFNNTVNIADLKDSSITLWGSKKNNVKLRGTTEELGNVFSKNITYLRLHGSKDAVTGDVNALSGFSKLESFFINEMASITGSMESFFVGLHTNGKRGTLTIGTTNAGTKFNNRSGFGAGREDYEINFTDTQIVANANGFVGTYDVASKQWSFTS